MKKSKKPAKQLNITLTSKIYSEILFNEELSLSTKFYLLTHFIKENKETSLLENFSDNLKPNLSDVFGSYGTDDYFITSRIAKNNGFLQQGYINLTCWLNNEKYYNEFWSLLYSVTTDILKNLQFDIRNEEIGNDYEYLGTSFNLYKNIPNEELKLLNINAYYLVFHIIVLIEKILRNVYLAFNPYCPIKQIQMKRLLVDTQCMENILGHHTQKFLLYYLSKNDNLIGKDMRNKIMHYNDININDFTYNTILEYMYLLVLVCNSIYTNSLNQGGKG